MREPLVSIIMPVYGVEKYIEESVKSIIDQKYRNIELIIVDDESNDKSIELAQCILEKSDVNYTIVKEINKGLPGARNNGANICKGEYICFIDSDDCIDSSHVQYLMEMIDKHHLEVCFTDFEYTNENNRKSKKLNQYSEKIYGKEELLKAFSMRDVKIHCCSLCIKKEVFEKYTFNEKLKYGEDVEFMWRLFSGQSTIGRVCVSTYKYLIRSNSIMTTYSYEKDKVFITEFEKSMKKLSEDYPVNKDIYLRAFYRNIFGWLHSVSKKTNYIQFEQAIYLINKNEMIDVLSKSDDFKVKVLVRLFHISDKMFFNIIKKI